MHFYFSLTGFNFSSLESTFLIFVIFLLLSKLDLEILVFLIILFCGCSSLLFTSSINSFQKSFLNSLNIFQFIAYDEYKQL